MDERKNGSRGSLIWPKSMERRLIEFKYSPSAMKNIIITSKHASAQLFHSNETARVIFDDVCGKKITHTKITLHTFDVAREYVYIYKERGQK